MGSIKQKEKINKESAGTFGDNEAYVYPLMKSRKQELEDRRKNREYPGVDDELKSLMRNTKGTLVRSEEHVPSSAANTVSSEELKKEHQYRKDKSGTSYFIH